RRRYIETVLEALSSGVVSFDPLGRLTTINRAAARMFGVNEAAVGQLLEEVFAGPDVKDVVALVQRTRRPNAGGVEQELLRRRLGRSAGENQQLVTECTGTIIQEVDGLRRLVDEFSRFARMPALAPRPTDLGPLVESVVALYRESHPGLTLVTRHAEDLPP